MSFRILLLTLILCFSFSANADYLCRVVANSAIQNHGSSLFSGESAVFRIESKAALATKSIPVLNASKKSLGNVEVMYNQMRKHAAYDTRIGLSIDGSNVVELFIQNGTKATMASAYFTPAGERFSISIRLDCKAAPAEAAL